MFLLNVIISFNLHSSTLVVLKGLGSTISSKQNLVMKGSTSDTVASVERTTLIILTYFVYLVDYSSTYVLILINVVKFR